MLKVIVLKISFVQNRKTFHFSVRISEIVNIEILEVFGNKIQIQKNAVEVRRVYRF